MNPNRDLTDDCQDRDCANCGELIYGYPGDICDACQLGWYEIAFLRLREQASNPHSAADLAETVYGLVEEETRMVGSDAPASFLSAQQVADRENGSLL